MSKFNLLLLTKLSPSQKDGFTMVEVLIAIMAATAFLLGTLQAVAINAVLQVRAERQAQATFWIQEDLENVKAAAADVINHPLPTYTFCGTLSYNTAFASQLRENLYENLDGKKKLFQTTSGNQRKADLTTSIKMSPVYTDRTTTYAPTNSNIQIAPARKLVNKDYRLVRIINPDSSKRNVLKITYRVGEPNNSEKSTADALTTNPTATDKINTVDMLTDDAPGKTSIIAELYAEVIPNVVFTC